MVTIFLKRITEATSDTSDSQRRHLAGTGCPEKDDISLMEAHLCPKIAESALAQHGASAIWMKLYELYLFSSLEFSAFEG